MNDLPAEVGTLSQTLVSSFSLGKRKGPLRDFFGETFSALTEDFQFTPKKERE